MGGRAITAWTAALALAGAGAVAAAETAVSASAAHVGAWGLEISIGRDCSVGETLNLPPGPTQGLFEACLEINATDVEVSGPGATLRSGRTITLGNDFSVATGSELTAEIVPAMGDDFASIRDTSPIAEAIYNATFYVDRDGLTLGAGDEIRHFEAYSADGTSLFALTLKPAGGGSHILHLEARQDGGGLIQTAPGQEIALPAGWTKLDVSWIAADGTGELLVAVNDGDFAGLTALDNDAYAVESVRWGSIDGLIAGSSGFLRLDGFNSWR